VLEKAAASNRTYGKWTIPLGVVLLLLLMVSYVVTLPSHGGHGESRASVARATVGKYANEAFPQWQMNNQALTCPSSLVELNDYMNNADGRDPWGTPYIMLCGASLPAGARGIAVLSFGPDREYGTVDDIQSWE
jgi:Type II secretion system (T2SS), protein G